jgi:anhydro-N-acetylmuramic acid kinase
MTQKSLYIGVMSGTSADGIDLALVEFDEKSEEINANGAKLIASYFQAYDTETQNRITSLYNPSANELDRAFSLGVILAQKFSKAINEFLQQQQLSPQDISAIGCHGQTVRHRPLIDPQLSIDAPFTLQICCHQTLAILTNIRVIGDFRTKDIALGGQGAPLVPAFHQAIFSSLNNDVFVVNIGGIANITFLPKDKKRSVCGFDTGPGNALMDYWYQEHQQGHYDIAGNWAKSGVINHQLLDNLLADKYFSMPAPKSTGREYFNATWLNSYIKNCELISADIQATLTAFTAHSISQEINKLSTKSDVYLCGGGVQNKHLVSLINQELNTHTLMNIHTKNVNSDSLEAMAFAWLAYAFDKNIFGNIPAVTGASNQTVLGLCFNP